VSKGIAMVMQERAALSRPARLGTRRRKPRQAVSVLPEAGGTSPRGARPSSLDTDNQPETSVASWLEEKKTGADLYREQCYLHAQLVDAFHATWQKWAAIATHDAEDCWLRRYSEVARTIEGESEGARSKRIKDWKRLNPPSGTDREALRWERAWVRLKNCQTEWIGLGAACCGARTRPYAVPVGCRHRLCPFCAANRSARSQAKVKKLFPKLEHPVLVTLTTPNVPTITKHRLQHLRMLVRKLLKHHPEFRGGIYSIEITYNRDEKTWHPHVHMLADRDRALPTTKDPRIDFCGKSSLPFMPLKWRLEFDWACLTNGWKCTLPSPNEPKKGRKKWLLQWSDYWFEFEKWTLAKRAHSTIQFKHKEGRKYVLRADLSNAELLEYARLQAWNARHTRVIDLRPVDDRDGAAREVLKYVTKVAFFSDVPEAVEEFSRATRGARMVQTWGTWYGIDLESDTDFDPAELAKEKPMQCACGTNHWKRIGFFHRCDVEIESGGDWRLKEPHNHNSSGTVSRPTIRALEMRE
jgi:hypothetical protein